MAHSPGSAESSVDRSLNDQMPDIPEGTPVVIGPEGTRRGKLVDGGLPQDEEYNVEFIDSYYGQALIHRSMLAVPLASFYMRPNLDLPQSTEVLYRSGNNILGEVVCRPPGQAHDGIACRTQDGEEGLYHVDQLAVPLNNWRWPNIPLGTTIAYFPDSTSCEEHYTAQEQSSANAKCDLIDERGGHATAKLEDLVVPLDKWYDQSSAGRRVVFLPSTILQGEVKGSPNLVGTYLVHLQPMDKPVPLHGRELAILLETRTHLDQVGNERKFEVANEEIQHKDMEAATSEVWRVEMETVAQQLADLRDENISLRGQVSALTAENEAFKRKEGDTVAQLSNLREENHSLQDQVSTQKADIETLMRREKEKDVQLADVRKKSNELQDQVRILTAESDASKRKENNTAASLRELQRKTTKMALELRNQNTLLQNQVSTKQATIDACKRKERNAATALADRTRELGTMAAQLKMLQDQNNLLEGKSRRLNVAIQGLKEEERKTAAAMTELKNQEMSTAVKLEKAREHVKKLQGERLILGATGDHNYGSTFPSPSDLVAKIKTIEGQHVTEWIMKALGEEVIPWPIGEEEAAKGVGTLKDFVCQVLVQTVLHCYQRVQSCVSSRKELMESFMPTFLGGGRGRLAKDFATFERSAFENGYKEIFAGICPETPGDKTKLAREVFQGLPTYESVSKAASQTGPNPNDLFDTTRESYEDIVTNLLMAFLECEIGKVTLQFSENFAHMEKWNPEEFQHETIDLSYEGNKPALGRTWVQVVIPRIFWEKDDGAKLFETKASFLVCSA